MRRDDFARIVHDVLNLPPPKSSIRDTVSARIVSAVVKSITDALLRGEDVYISGIGKFTIRTKKATRSPVPYCYHDIGDLRGNAQPPKFRTWKLRNISERKYVHFEPSKDLVRGLNE